MGVLARRRIGPMEKIEARRQDRKAKRKAAPAAPATSTQLIVMNLPLHMDTFERISCSREKATWHQKNLYRINKDNAAGRVYASRYNYSAGELLIWRMA